MKYATLIAFIILFVSIIALVRYCSTDREYAPTEREKSLQADTARLSKKVAYLEYQLDSTNKVNLIQKKEVKDLKDEKQAIKNQKPKNLKDSVKQLIEENKVSDKIIEKQDEENSTLESKNETLMNINNSLLIKVKDVSGLDTIHFQALLKEKRKNFWHEVKDWFFISLAAIMTIIAVAK